MTKSVAGQIAASIVARARKSTTRDGRHLRTDFVVSFVTPGPGSTTLPILSYSSVNRGITPDINVLATVMVVALVVGTPAVTLPRKPGGTKGLSS